MDKKAAPRDKDFIMPRDRPQTEWIDRLARAVSDLHRCQARYRDTVYVRETHEGETAWRGDVAVFDLDGHGYASVCYAWSEPVPGSDRHRFYAVLHIPPVQSAADAVRAVIREQFRQRYPPPQAD